MRQYLQPCAHLDGRLADSWCKDVWRWENFLPWIGRGSWTSAFSGLLLCELQIFSLNGEVVLEEIEGHTWHVGLCGRHAWIRLWKKGSSFWHLIPVNGVPTRTPVLLWQLPCDVSRRSAWWFGHITGPPKTHQKHPVWWFGNGSWNHSSPRKTKPWYFWRVGWLIQQNIDLGDPRVASQKHWKERFQGLGITLVMMGMLVRGVTVYPKVSCHDVVAGATCWYQHAQCCTKGSWTTKTRQGNYIAENERSTLVEFHFGSSFLGCVEDSFCRNLSVSHLIVFDHSGNA